jgi:mono/diheme cytochrome c family protein
MRQASNPFALLLTSLLTLILTATPGLTNDQRPMTEVQLPPALAPIEALGAMIFAANCAQCHGTNGAGNLGSGPPLIHKVYEPGHHGDPSFERAVQDGVTSHHWPFGDMPPQPHDTPAMTKAIIAYIRRVQKENDIF